MPVNEHNVEFGSAAWAAAAARLLDDVAREFGPRIAGSSVAVRDIYTDAPADLGGPTVAFTFGVADGCGFAELGERRAVDMRMTMPFETARAGAKAILSLSADDIAARDARRAAAVASGALQVEGSLDAAPLAVRQAFVEWHNRLAEIIA